MATQIRGMVDTTEILQARRDFDWGNQIHFTYANQFPLPYLLYKYSKEKATNAKFDVLQNELPADTIQINKVGGYNAAAVSLVFDDVTNVIVGDIIHLPRTNENCEVTTVNTGTNTLIVTRGVGSTTAQTINDDDVFFLIGTAFAEGSSPATAVTTKVEDKYNYCQIFKESVYITKSMAASTFYGGDEESRQLKLKQFHFEKKLNYALQFGGRSTSETNKRLTGGLRYWISTNIKDCGAATLTKALFDDWLRMMFEKKVGESTMGKKTVIASAYLCQRIADFTEATIRTENPAGDLRYGFKVVEYTSPFGSVDIFLDRLLTGTTYAYWGWGLELDLVKYKYLRDVMLRRNLPTEDDSIKHELIGEIGLKLIAEQAHGAIKNFT
jgi:hypothetical protein